MSNMNKETRLLIDRIVDAYLHPKAGIDTKGNPPRAQLKSLESLFNMSSARIRKILIGEGVFKNKNSVIVGELIEQGKSVDEIMRITGLGKSSVNNYMAYGKGLYNNELTTETENNKRVLKHRENKVMEDSMGSVLSSSSRKRVLFFSKTDLSVGFYIDSVKDYLMNNHDITSLHDAIHAYNCYLFINNGISGKDWSDEEKTLIMHNSKTIKEKVCRFLFANSSIVLEEIDALERDYQRSILRMATSFNLYRKWNREQFQKILNDLLIREVMEIEKLVIFFDCEITQYLIHHIENTSEMLFENNYIHTIAKSDIRYYFPPSFGLKERIDVLSAYCQSENPSINGLICILNMKDVFNRFESDIKELIRRTIDKQTVDRMNSLPKEQMASFGLGVRFVSEKTNTKEDGIMYMDYPLEELDNRLDYDGIQFCLRKMFGLIDPQNGLVPLSRRRRDFSLVDDLLGTKFKDGYNLDSKQQAMMALIYGTLVLYYNYLNSHGISLEDHLGKAFSLFLKEKCQIDLMGFELPAIEGSFLTKCTAIAPIIEALINRLYLIGHGKTIDKYSLSSISGISLSSLDSLLPDKYLYITNNKKKKIIVENLSYLLFSFQHLFLINKERLDNQKLNCNFDLLILKSITRSEIMDYDQHKVSFLLDNKCIVEHNGCLKPTNRALALKELWENGCIATYHSPCGLKVLATLKKDGWLIGENSLLSKPEQELLSFIYDNKLFSDAWGLRNCYAHGSLIHLDEDQHKQNYMWLLFIIIVLEAKLEEEIEVLTENFAQVVVLPS